MTADVEPRKTRTPLAIWNKAQGLYEQGETLSNIANLFKLSVSGVYKRAKAYGWVRRKGPAAGRKPKALPDKVENGAGEAEKGGEEGSPGGTLSDATRTRANSLSVKGFVDVGQMFKRLKHLEDAPPEVYQAGAVKVLQDMVSQGFTQIKAPETWQELKTAFELWRKAAGLDVKDKSTAPVGLVRPMRTLARQNPVVATIAAPVEVVAAVDPGSPADAPDASLAPVEASAVDPGPEDDGLGVEP